MTTSEDVRQALKVPGRVCAGLGSTLDFSTDFPHGGYDLGALRGARVKHTEVMSSVVFEDFGPAVEIADLLEAGERWELVLMFRGWNADAIRATFANTSAGASSGQRRINWPGPRGEGELRSENRATSLLFSPDSDEHPAVYFPQALPVLQGERELLLRRREELVLLTGWVATRSSAATGSGAQVGLLEDLTAVPS